MDNQISNDGGATVGAAAAAGTSHSMDTGEVSPPTLHGAVPVDTAFTIALMGSGDASAPVMVPSSVFTARDVQDMILPDPSVMNLLAPLVAAEHFQDMNNPSSNDISCPLFLDRRKERITHTRNEDELGDDKNIKLTRSDLFDIKKFNSSSADEERSELKFDLAKVKSLFRCETCQESPISSATVHTCNFGHQVCGSCFNNGVRKCVVCKGHLHGNNVPLENVLQRLRKNYPAMFPKSVSRLGEGVDIDCVSRFYSLKPIICPEDGCMCQCSARSLPKHFETEHKSVPTREVSLFTPFMVSVPKGSLENENGNVIAVINLKVTKKEVTSEMFTDTMTCWVQCGAIPTGMSTNALAVWVSCAYEETMMPPILYDLRVSTPEGYSSFGGQMVPLHDYMGPKVVLADGKCLLLFPKVLQDVISFNDNRLDVELRFYLR